MIFAARCLGLGIVLGMNLGGLSPLYAQSSSTAVPTGSSTVAPVRSSLTLGSQGPEVTELQSILQLLGFYLGRVDGVFSEATQQGVQRFQQAAGLPTTGQMTLGDWNRLLPIAGVQSSQPALQPAPIAAAVTPQPNPVPPVPDTILPPNPTAQSFPIPEAASQPPSGSSGVAPPSLPPSGTPNPDRSPKPAAEPALDNTSEPQSDASQESITFPLLKLGDEGTAVERLQQRLGALGFYSGEIDGIFGEGTEDSVRQFQEQFDLEIDGIVGRSTWETLFN